MTTRDYSVEGPNNDFQAFIEVDRHSDPKFPYTARATQKASFSPGPGPVSYSSGPQATKREAWRVLIIHLMKMNSIFRRQRDDARELVNKLQKSDDVLANEVRMRHELQEDLSRVEEWRKAELEEMTKLKQDHDALRKAFQHLGQQREKEQVAHEQTSEALKLVMAERDAIRRAWNRMRDIINSTS